MTAALVSSDSGLWVDLAVLGVALILALLTRHSWLPERPLPDPRDRTDALGRVVEKCKKEGAR